MSASTTAILYRPGPPPVITTSSLADFIERLIALDIRDESTRIRASLKFGKSIDQDHRDVVIEKVIQPGLTEARFIKWDAEVDVQSPAEFLEWLRSPFKKRGLFARRPENPPIYRALIDFGSLKADVYGPLSREEDEANNVGPLWLWNLCLSVGPEKVADPQGDGTIYMVGWMSVSAGGQGYIWPWTYDDTLARVKASEPLQRVCELCRSFWPVIPTQPTPEQVNLRRRMGHLWGGNDYDAPPDWRWTINESY